MVGPSGRLGGPQTVYRMSSLRQDLQLDFIPTNVKVADFAEALQAEAEQLSLMSASPTSTTTASLQDTKKKEQIKAAPYGLKGLLLPTMMGRGSQNVVSGGARLVVAEVNLVLLSTLGTASNERVDAGIVPVKGT